MELKRSFEVSPVSPRTDHGRAFEVKFGGSSADVRTTPERERETRGDKSETENRKRQTETEHHNTNERNIWHILPLVDVSSVHTGVHGCLPVTALSARKFHRGCADVQTSLLRLSFLFVFIIQLMQRYRQMNKSVSPRLTFPKHGNLIRQSSDSDCVGDVSLSSPNKPTNAHNDERDSKERDQRHAE